ncbi:MAG: hypothetical protein AAFO69_04540, partial [Bacteroidota bacterium]
YLTINEFGMAGNTTPAGNEGSWDGFIRSGQGFFVQSDPSGGSVTFNNSMKSSTNNTDGGFFRESQPDRLRIVLKGQDANSDALIGFDERASSSKDRGFDARKFDTGNGFSIYSLLNDQRYVIQALSSDDDQSTIKIGYEVVSAGTYELILHNDLYPNYAVVQLYDQEAERIIDLNPGSNKYAFSTDSGKFDDRFIILTDKTAVVTSVYEDVEAFPFTATFYSLKGDLVKTVVFESPGQQNLLQGLENRLLLMRRSDSPRVRKVRITQ